MIVDSIRIYSVYIRKNNISEIPKKSEKIIRKNNQKKYQKYQKK